MNDNQTKTLNNISDSVNHFFGRSIDKAHTWGDVQRDTLKDNITMFVDGMLASYKYQGVISSGAVTEIYLKDYGLVVNLDVTWPPDKLTFKIIGQETDPAFTAKHAEDEDAIEV